MPKENIIQHIRSDADILDLANYLDAIADRLRASVETSGSGSVKFSRKAEFNSSAYAASDFSGDPRKFAEGVGRSPQDNQGEN